MNTLTSGTMLTVSITYVLECTQCTWIKVCWLKKIPVGWDFPCLRYRLQDSTSFLYNRYRSFLRGYSGCSVVLTNKWMGSAQVWRVNFTFTNSSLHSVLLGYEAAPLVKGILTFRNNVLSSSSRVKCHRRILLEYPVIVRHCVMFKRTETPATQLRQPHLLHTP